MERGKDSDRLKVAGEELIKKIEGLE